MKTKLCLLVCALSLNQIQAQIRTNGTLISPSTGTHNIFVGNNAISATPGTGKAKLEVRADQLFTNQNWSSAIRVIAESEGSFPQNAAAIIWDKGVNANNQAPYHFFMAGPANSPRGDFFTGWAADYGNAGGNQPIYVNSIYSSIRDQNAIGSVRFYKSIIMHDGAGTPANELGIGVMNPSEQLHTNQGVRFEGLTLNTSAPRMVVQDATGKLFYNNISNLVTNSCATTNFLPKMGTGNQTVCSQIFDNGTNIGVSTSSPVTKLHVNGQSLWLTGGNGSALTSGAGLRLYYDVSTNRGNIFAWDYSAGTARDLVLQTSGGNVGIHQTPGTWTGAYLSILGTPPNPTPVKLDVNGMVRCQYLVVTSDEKMKTNIKKLENSLEKVLKLKGVTYNWNQAYSKEKQLDGFGQIGFLAQEVAKVVPEAVGVNQDGEYAMNYISLIPLLSEAIKEQNNTINELKEKIELLSQNESNNLTPTGVSINNSTSIENALAKMGQNAPNPFNKETTISCQIPENVSSASLYVFDMQGKQLKKLDIATRGNVDVKIEANQFTPGMYLYGLFTDGKEVSVKRMIITE
jgi:hypothetical protein